MKESHDLTAMLESYGRVYLLYQAGDSGLRLEAGNDSLFLDRVVKYKSSSGNIRELKVTVIDQGPPTLIYNLTDHALDEAYRKHSRKRLQETTDRLPPP